ncbi:hypothetical protein [Ensifer sp. SL37]|uniref:hypothetical protein n=1 Tax=Ensifer sp. SL37 TaxID=2995137 RepID=UPI002276C1FD|nr:hypothetical protein [Ensifer sp. SL37]MCY1744277.1 hypothetical protein [Ensifer sp. SL37]
MANVKFMDYCRAIFAPFIQLADLPSEPPKLKTAPLGTEALEYQGPILNSLHALGKPVLLGGNSFLLRARTDDNIYFYINTDGLSVDETFRLHEFMGDMQAEKVDPLECHFMFVSLNMSGTYRIKKDFRRKDYARDMISAANISNYDGHDINTMMEMFEEYAIYRTDIDKEYLANNNWYLPTKIALNHECYRSQVASERICLALSKLSDLVVDDLENIYNALTSTHLSQMYLEIYRYLENLFALPWGVEIKRSLGVAAPAVVIALECRKSLQWKAREDDSIRALFALAGLEELLAAGANKVKNFSDILGSEEKEDKSRTIGRRIYKIRNMLVHKEDFDDKAPLDLKEAIDEDIICFMVNICTHLYGNFGAEISRLRDRDVA